MQKVAAVFTVQTLNSNNRKLHGAGFSTSCQLLAVTDARLTGTSPPKRQLSAQVLTQQRSVHHPDCHIGGAGLKLRRAKRRIALQKGLQHAPLDMHLGSAIAGAVAALSSRQLQGRAKAQTGLEYGRVQLQVCSHPAAASASQLACRQR